MHQRIRCVWCLVLGASEHGVTLWEASTTGASEHGTKRSQVNDDVATSASEHGTKRSRLNDDVATGASEHGVSLKPAAAWNATVRKRFRLNNNVSPDAKHSWVNDE